MKTLDAIRALNDIAASQKGLFTTAQAGAAGVARYTISRLENLGNVERLAQGVYRMGGAPSLREEDVLAAWLSVDPTRQPGMVISENSPVAMGATAAWVLGLGEIGPTPYEFCVRKRKQTQRGNIRLRRRDIDLSSVVIVSGIPTTAAPQTILDLIDDGEDLSLIANVLGDALEQGLIDSVAELRDEVDRRGPRLGVLGNGGLYKMLTDGRNNDLRKRGAV